MPFTLVQRFAMHLKLTLNCFQSRRMEWEGLRRPHTKAAELVYAPNPLARRNTGNGNPLDRPAAAFGTRATLVQCVWRWPVAHSDTKAHTFGWRLEMLKRQVTHEAICWTTFNRTCVEKLRLFEWAKSLKPLSSTCSVNRRTAPAHPYSPLCVFLTNCLCWL